MKSISSSSVDGDEHRSQSNYRLREHPKKSSWMHSSFSDVDDVDDDNGLFQCSKCRRCLSSWNRLHEHMRIHGDQGRRQLDDHCSNSAALAIATVPKKRRGARGTVSSLVACSGSSASVSMSIQYGCDEEGEYGAIEALIMLSRGVLGCCSESSDKNSSVVHWGNEVEGTFDAELSCNDSDFATKFRFSEFGGSSLQKIGDFDASVSKNCGGLVQDSNLKKSSYECVDCHKVFASYRALGGHRAGHKKRKGCASSTGSSAGLSVIDESPDRSHLTKKRKAHNCEACGQVFSSGQALGRHKSCRLIEKTSENACDADVNMTKILNQQQPIEA